MVAPQVPGDGAVGQALCDHQPHGQGDDALGVMAAGRGEVGEVGADVATAAAAVVPGVGDAQPPGPVAQKAAKVVQGTLAAGVAVTRTAAAWTRPAAIVTRALAEEGRGEILDPCDSLGALRDVLSGSGSHGGLRCQPGRAPTEESGDEEKSTRNPLSLLQSRDILGFLAYGSLILSVVCGNSQATFSYRSGGRFQSSRSRCCTLVRGVSKTCMRP